MDNKINLAQLTELFCKESTLAKGVSATFVKSFFETVISEVSTGEQVRIKGFGTFKQTTINDRESVNVNTGERFVIPGHTKISFTPDPVLKDFINKPFANFETVVLDSQTSVGNEEPASVTSPKDIPSATVYDEPLDDSEEAQKNVKEEEKDNTSVAGLKQKPVEKRMIGLKTFLKIFGILLTILVISYCIWPLNLMHLMRSKMDQMESNDAETAKVEVVRTEKPRNAVQTQTSKKTETPSAAETPSTAEMPAFEVKESVATEERPIMSEQEQASAGQKQAAAEQKQAEAKKLNDDDISSVFTLTEADRARPVGSFTPADTVSYRMLDAMATHTLAGGETLVKLSELYYGTKILWPYLAAYNGIENADMLYVGMKIDIPELANK